MTSKPKDENKDAYEEAVQIGQELAGRLQTHDMSEVMSEWTDHNSLQGWG